MNILFFSAVPGTAVAVCNFIMENKTMLVFENQISLAQFLIPPVCFGVLAGGFFLYILMSWKFRSSLYLTITLLISFGMIFVGSELLVITVGGWHHNRELSLQFHRTEQLAGAYFLFGLPYSLIYFLKLNEKWQRVNFIIAMAGLLFVLVLTVLAFTVPDTFISMTKHKATWMFYEADYGRGQEGILYFARDALLGFVILYSIICFIIDIFWYKNITYLLYPVIGLSFAFYGAVIDSLHIYTGNFYDFFSDAYFSRVSLGVTIALLFFVYSVTKRFIITAKGLETANKIISISEEKYRFLVDGTNDCILSLDINFNIVSANKAVFSQLCVETDSLNSVNLYDLFYLENDEKNLTLQFIRERMHALISEGIPADFKVFFKFRGTMEPREYHIRIEHISVGDRKELLVKASSIPEDTIMKYIDREGARFRIGNYLITADEISNRLVASLPKFLERNQINSIKIGLREIIINSIEHGNMNITFNEKTKATEEGNYTEFVLSRQNEPAYRNRKVTIEYLFDHKQVAYFIEDEGNGFNYKKIIKSIQRDVDRNMLEHGRGLRIAFNIFDVVKFNKKGNMVTLIKKFG